MTYDQPREVMWLLDQAQITLAPDKGKDPGLKIVAGTAGMARREKYFRFERGFTATREGRVLSADSAMAYLTDDEERLRSLELRGQLAHRDERRHRGRAAVDERARHQPRVRRGRRDARTRRAGRRGRDAAGRRQRPAGPAHRRRGDRRHGGSRRRGHVAGRARQGRAFAARVQGRPRARDSRREHERHRRAAARGSPARSSTATWSSANSATARRRASRDRGPCRWCSAPTAASTRRNFAGGTTFEDGVTQGARRSRPGIWWRKGSCSCRATSRPSRRR